MFELKISKLNKPQLYKILPVISHDGRMDFWIGNEDGEGMQVLEDDFFDIIDKFFREKF